MVVVLDGTWYCDDWDPNLKILHRIRATLFEGASEYQRIQVLDTHEFGRLLVIDGLPQAAESDEGVYARAITWPDSAACTRACLFGDESQQPIFPQVMHMRRCTQRLPILRQSSQPAIEAGSSVSRI